MGKATGAIKGGARGAGSGAAEGWHALSDEGIKDHEIRKAIAADRAAGDRLPNHSQLAKDDTDHPLYGVSRMLAIIADREIGTATLEAWKHPGDHRAVEQVTALVDKFVCHPADKDWWRGPLITAAGGKAQTGPLTLPAAAAQKPAGVPAGVR